jgi:sulfite reductase alpha subunit-like flavoprotein
MPDAYEKFVSLYELLFQIMDIAMAINEPCILQNIIQSTISKSILFKSIFSKLLSLASDPDIDELIEELQIDVDLIQTNGFGAFEQKIIDMFKEFEEDDKLGV